MPLSEFYRMAKGKMDDFQSKTSGVSYMPDNEFAELVWEDGQVMMQGQSKDKKTPVCNNFQFFTSRTRERDIGSSKMGKFEAIESSLNMPISVEMSMNHDDDMVPWLNYPIQDPLEHDYCSNILPEISGVTVHELSMHYGSTVDQGNSSKVSSSRVSHVFPWKSHQIPTTMAPFLVSGVSDIIIDSARNNPRVISGDSRQGQSSSSSSSGGVSQMKLQNQDSGLPCRTSGLLNFSHFSRPVTLARADNQNGGLLANYGASGIERMGNSNKQSIPNNNIPAELKPIAPNCGLQREMGFQSQSNLIVDNANSKPLVNKQLEGSGSGEQLDTGCREDGIHGNKPPNLALGSVTAKGLPDSEKHTEPILAASSVCSGNSLERASNHLSNNLKRKRSDTEDSEWQSEDADEESVGVKKVASCRGGTGSKRSRAAEVHNLSERRRRDRINEKMRALQELIPNCNKVDKASMLDEAIEFLKSLQLQVQMMSMGAGLCMPPMMFTAGMQHMHAAHLRHYSHMGMGMGMGFGMGMGMVDHMNDGYNRRPIIPMPGQCYPSPHIPSPSSFQGIQPRSNLHTFGHIGQSVPMPFPQGSPVPKNASTQPMHNADDTNNSMNQPSSQFQTKNVDFDQSSFSGKNDQAAASSTSTKTNSNDSTPSR